MTTHRSFKRLVRTRMRKTGESYTAARAVLLAAREAETPREAPVLATSDEAIRERTGRGWEEWFDLLDAWGAAERSHRDIARWVAEQLDVAPLAWDAQAIATSFERARGLRAVGEHADGFTITVSRTLPATAQRVFEAFVDEAVRARWLPEGQLRQRTATAPRSARFDWGDGPTRVHVVIDARGEARSTVSLTHVRLADAREAEDAKARWRERLGALRTLLERGDDDA